MAYYTRLYEYYAILKTMPFCIMSFYNMFWFIMLYYTTYLICCYIVKWKYNRASLECLGKSQLQGACGALLCRLGICWRPASTYKPAHDRQASCLSLWLIHCDSPVAVFLSLCCVVSVYSLPGLGTIRRSASSNTAVGRTGRSCDDASRCWRLVCAIFQQL